MELVIVKRVFMDMIAHFQKVKEELDVKMIVGAMVIVWEEFAIVIQDILEKIVNNKHTFCVKRMDYVVATENAIMEDAFVIQNTMEKYVIKKNVEGTNST